MPTPAFSTVIPRSWRLNSEKMKIVTAVVKKPLWEVIWSMHVTKMGINAHSGAGFITIFFSGAAVWV